MLADAGNNRIRINVLRDAAKSLVDELYEDNGLTLIPFADTAAKLTDLAEAGPSGSTVRGRGHTESARHCTHITLHLSPSRAGREAEATHMSNSRVCCHLRQLDQPL